MATAWVRVSFRATITVGVGVNRQGWDQDEG